MNITLEQLQHAVQRCTPGAPDSYASRIWAELEKTGDQPNSFPRYRRPGRHNPDDPANRRIWPHDRKEDIL